MIQDTPNTEHTCLSDTTTNNVQRPTTRCSTSVSEIRHGNIDYHIEYNNAHPSTAVQDTHRYIDSFKRPLDPQRQQHSSRPHTTITHTRR